MPIRVNTLVVIAKAPEPGKAKTRLVPPLSFEEAAEVARCLLLDQLEHLRSYEGADLFVAFTPAESASWFKKNTSPAYTCFPQQGQDLGERMSHCFGEIFARGYKNMVLVGSDLPPLPLRFLNEAYRILSRPKQGIVLGPSRDGGYYLIGMNHARSDLFEGIAWGGNDVLACTLDKLARAGSSPELLPTWFDIDTAEDLLFLKSNAAQFSGDLLKRTLAHLRQLPRSEETRLQSEVRAGGESSK